MSIIFGIREAADQPVDVRYLRDLARATERYAPDGSFVAAKANIGMGYQPYYTHEHSRREMQPAIDEAGSMLCFDGRLDNHKELRTTLGLADDSSAGSGIVRAAFTRWDKCCFSRFIGDWALALWSNADHALYLARDHAGTRTLYYQMMDGHVL